MTIHASEVPLSPQRLHLPPSPPPLSPSPSHPHPHPHPHPHTHTPSGWNEDWDAIHGIPLSRYRWLVPLPAACLLQLTFGLLYALGVFVAFIDRPAFTLSLGVVGFCIALGITLAGVAMTSWLPDSRYRVAPCYIAAVGGLGFLAQVAMAAVAAVATPGPALNWLLFASAAVVGLGGGCVYVASVDVLQAWVPEAPGMVTGAGMLCGGSGTLLGIHAFRSLTHLFHSPVRALALAGMLAAFAAISAAPFITRPPKGWRPRPAPAAHPPEDERTYLLPPSPARLGVRDLLTDPAFYVVLVAFAASVGPGYGFVLAFQRMTQAMFGLDADTANDLFFSATVAGVAGRLVVGVAVDSLQRRHRSRCRADGEDVLYGARTTTMVVLGAQAVALACMPALVHVRWVRGFAAAAAVVSLAFSAGPVLVACLVREAFGEGNSSLAFALGAVSIGGGDVFFAWVVAVCGKGDSYSLLFVLGGVWSVLGLAACRWLQVSTKLTDVDWKATLRTPV